jgi:4'-phosphopantetheinyl transferase
MMDPLLQPGPLAGVRVAWVNLDHPPDPPARLEGWLSAVELDRARRFRFDVDRRRFVAARGVLRRLLAAELGISPSDVAIEADGFGKPRLAAAHRSDLRFNLSHAAARGLYGFAEGRPVGVDTEDVRPLSDLDSLAREVLSPAEVAEWRSNPPELRLLAFFSAWTRKEAFVKALGRGLDFPLHDFDVSLTPGRPPAILRLALPGSRHSDWSVSAWSPEPGFVAALVTGSASAPAE